MGESITADDGFVGLYRHPHQTGYQLAGSDDLPGVDTDIEIQIFVTGNRHYDFFEGGVTGLEEIVMAIKVLAVAMPRSLWQ